MLGLIVEPTGSAEVRRIIRYWSRPLPVTIQHRLSPAGVRGDLRHRLAEACEAIRRHAWLLAVAIGDRARPPGVIEHLGFALQVSGREKTA